MLPTSFGVKIIDAMDLLEAPRFIDQVHPDHEGARRLSSLIAEELAGGP